MALEQAGVQLVAEGAAQFFGDMSKASGAVNQFSDDANSAAGKTTGASDIMTGALRQVGAVAVNAFMEAGKAAIGFVKDSIGVAGDFESGMNKFAAVAGGALDDAGIPLKAFRDQFIQIGKELPVSTSEVQQAAIEMVKGGIDPATIAAGGLKQVIQFAAAADLDLAQAAEISAKAIGGWVSQTASADEKAAFLTHSTDLLAKAANASTVDVDDLALGLYNVQGPAKLAGVSFDETVTTLAQLAPNFASSADAGTSFKAFLSRLQPTTQPAIDAMKALNLVTADGNSVFYDAQGNFVGMEKASQLLADATNGLNEAQKAQLLTTIFGQDGIRTAAVLSEQGAAGYDAMTASLEKQNSVQEMAAQKQAGFNTAMDNFKGSIEALQITIGSALLPILTDLFNNVLAPAINTMTDLAAAVFGDQDAFGRLSPELQGVVGVFQEVIGIVNDVIQGFDEGGLGGAINTVLNEVLGLNTNIGFLVDDSLSALVDIFKQTGDESSTLGGDLGKLNGVWENLRGVVEKVMAAYQHIVEAVLPIVQNFIADHGEEIQGFFQTTFDTIIDIVNTALDLYEAIVPPVLEAIASFIATNGAQIESIVDGIWKAVSGIIDAALAIIKGILTVALALIKGDWEGAWNAVQETAQRVWDDIKQIIDGNVQAIGGIIDIFIGYIQGIPGKVSGVGEAAMNAIWDGMKAVWQNIVDWLNAQLEWFRSQLPGSEPKDPSSPLRGLGKAGAAIMGNLMDGMTSGQSLKSGMIAPPAVIMPRPSVQLIQPASTSNTTNTVNNYGMGGASSPYSTDSMMALFGGRG